MASSASANELWSSNCSFFYFYYLLFCLSKKRGHLWAIPRAAFINCLDTWLKQIGFVSGRGCHFIFRALFILYISQFLPHFSPISSLLIIRESSSLHSCHHADLVPLLPSFGSDRHLLRNRLLYLVSHLFLYFFLSFIFFFFF